MSSTNPTPTESAATTVGSPRRQLTLFDTTCIIMGIIIGSGLYQSSPTVAGGAGSIGVLMALWIGGAIVTLIGSVCYAELATAYPKDGGDYVYLTRCYGGMVGFLFAWAQLWIVRPGSIGALAFVFAQYAHQLIPIGPEGTLVHTIYAAVAVIVLSVINVFGVRSGKTTQNILTLVKVLGLAAVLIVGFLLSSPDPKTITTAGPLPFWNIQLSIIFILFAYAGWNEMACVAAEVREPQKNILRSLVLGITAVAVIYIAANLAFIHALGYNGFAHSDAVATEVLGRSALGVLGGRAISALICASALGAINGLIFAAPINYAVGKEHPLFAPLGVWSRRLDTPLNALFLQTVVTLGLVVGFGWAKDGFTTLVTFTTPVFFIFFLLVGLSVILLRIKDPGTPRPYRAFLYPLTPILFCLSSSFMLYNSLTYAWSQRSNEAFWALGGLALGVLMSVVNARFDAARRRDGSLEMAVPSTDAPLQNEA